MSLIILCLATFGIVALMSSGLVGALGALLRGPISRLAPAAQARVFLAAATLPLSAALLVLGAALAPSFGWISDHYSGETHSHPHLCAAHQIADWPSIPLVLLALLVAARLLQTLLQSGRALWLFRQALASMGQASHTSVTGLRIIPTDEPQAFVVGLFRPRIYATRGLLAGDSKHHFPAVLAHEEAHLRRRDPLRKFVANIGLSLHVPALARRIEIAHERALEMAADEQAASVVGSRSAVASALVALAKARLRVPQLACGVAGNHSASDIERRVVQLMKPRARRDWPKSSVFVLAATSALLLIALAADTVHHEVEFLLGVFGS